MAMGRRKIRRPLIFWVTMQRIIDLRSDTVTRPSKKMREVIANAVVGDDVFEDDPTVKKLEQATADILGKEAALFVPSGTMANQISLRTLCDPGDEVICERGAHIVNHEVAAASALSGIMLSPYDGKKGRLDPGLSPWKTRTTELAGRSWTSNISAGSNRLPGKVHCHFTWMEPGSGTRPPL